MVAAAFLLFHAPATAQTFGNTIRLRDSVLSPTTPITLNRVGARWESAPTNGVVYRYDANGLSVGTADGSHIYSGGFILGSGSRTPMVLFWSLPYSGPIMGVYGVDVAKWPPDPMPWVFYELE